MSGSVPSHRDTPLLFTELAYACLGGLLGGMTLGYSSTAIPALHSSPLRPTASEESLIGSLMPVGGLFGGLAAGWLMEAVGRRSAMVAITVPSFAGWLLISYAGSVGVILVGRVLSGLTTGAASVVVPTYVGEVCQPQLRGAMGASYQLLTVVGVLLSYVLGKYLSWRWLALTSGCFSVVWLTVLCCLKQSPLWLVGSDREVDAHDSLRWLRGPAADINAELAQMRAQIEERRAKQASFRDLRRPENLKPFLMSLVIMFGQQLCGINAVIFYTKDIFSDAGSTIDSSLSTIIVGIVQVLSTFAGVVLVDRLGRKPLLVFSDVVMGGCLVALGVYFHLSKTLGWDLSSLGWLPLISLMLYMFAFSVGFGPVPFVLISELFAPEVKGLAAGVALGCNWALAALVTGTFGPLVRCLTAAGVFWLYAGVCAFGTAGVVCLLVETKGKTLPEIQQLFRRRAG